MITLVFLLLLGLTFFLTLVMRILGYLYKLEISIPEVIRYNASYVWLALIVIIGVLGGKSFNIALPSTALDIGLKGWFYILLVFSLFCIYSSYDIPKTSEQFIKFSIIFPIGEEILFRGIIQSLTTNLLKLHNRYIILPLFGSIPIVACISAICFGITHFQYHNFKINKLSLKQVLFAFVFGIFAGNIVEVTGSILYPVLFHIAGNTGTIL
ncbi:CPBP family intramembrane glutamic endopeptidase [Lutispora saccharofermentans]|uniref:CPBP family intramembrane metalloprotease n=1 Tax=Lutispora saccharofermentans TaxID=3024236 RepID=A0ABT1NJ42_9FIRM|nr:CPBP family intramembrane glutamic endopeptidase [Lutispora saccharofermentans]MCQ1531287.1 CPBP family intramembrane metalloprotease [Lutispora saccharofermentans]